ncbi:Cell wall protein phiA [Pseudocercospora fuligena]|uniref:Cell wall protein phiA n=1 Tax=Pseudocercospora fuligena TaxID=685502 RepID=A0A8H6RAX3_9PEZI|nr:Cell wall protein phiA [Pseudocercospora fuligena]
MGISATGTNITNINLTASKGRLFIGGKQAPKCEGDQKQDFATFALYSDGTVFLWKVSNPPQQLWVDASGMGMGITGYTSGDEKAPRNASRGKFAVDKDGYLTFEGTGAKACPTTEEGKWSVWFTTNEKPGWQDGCVDVKLKAYKAPARVACEYSHGS